MKYIKLILCLFVTCFIFGCSSGEKYELIAYEPVYVSEYKNIDGSIVNVEISVNLELEPQQLIIKKDTLTIISNGGKTKAVYTFKPEFMTHDNIYLCTVYDEYNLKVPVIYAFNTDKTRHVLFSEAYMEDTQFYIASIYE